LDVVVAEIAAEKKFAGANLETEHAEGENVMSARRLGKRAFHRKKRARDFWRAIRGANAARRHARGALNALPPAIARARAKVHKLPGVVNACHCDITSRDGGARQALNDWVNAPHAPLRGRRLTPTTPRSWM